MNETGPVAAGFFLIVGNSVEEAVRKHAEIETAMKDELAKYETPEGVVLASSSWKISARNPG